MRHEWNLGPVQCTSFIFSLLASSAPQSQTRSQCKRVEAQIHNPEINTASETYCAITLPVAQLPTSGKQPSSSYYADKNQVMPYNIHFPPEKILVAGLSEWPNRKMPQGRHTH